jgi:hypothetical protein
VVVVEDLPELAVELDDRALAQVAGADHVEELLVSAGDRGCGWRADRL